MIELHGSGEFRVMAFPEERKKIDIGDYYSSYAHFQAVTGWQPQRTLRQTLQRTLDYYADCLQRYI